MAANSRSCLLAVVTMASLVLLVDCGSKQEAVVPLAARPMAAASMAAPTATEAPPTATPEPTPELRSALAGRRICLDPGHDARWVPGATGYGGAGTVPRHPVEGIPLYEHELTLSVAYRVKALLEAEGAAVCVTRKPRVDGGGLQKEPYDYTGDGRVRTAASAEDGPERIQPRIDWANDFGAEVLVSIHYNGLEDKSVRGTEVYFTDGGQQRQQGKLLASSLLAGLLAEMRAAGFEARDRGIRSDAYQRYSPDETSRTIANNAAIIRANGADPANCPACMRLLTTGNNPMSLHPGRYVGALVEVEFLSNPAVVEGFVMRPDSLDIVARGLVKGLRTYFSGD